MAELRQVAVILAGGTGTRVGLSIPGQLIEVAGKPIIEHTIGVLQASLMTPGHLDAGHIVDVRREDEPASHLNAAVTAEELHEEEPGDVVPLGVDADIVLHG